MRAKLMVALLLACGGSDQPEQAHSAGGEHPHHHSPGHHHDFSDVERFAAIFDAPDRDEWQKPTEVVRLMALAEASQVVDLGAGTGYFLAHLSRAVGPTGHVDALDVEPAMVAHMSERIGREELGNVEARAISTDDPELADASVDAILIVDTWHHVSDRSSYAAKLARALRVGGAVWIVDFTVDAPEGPPPEMRLSAEQVITELQSAGLDAALVQETLPYQYMIRATVP